MLGPEEDGYSEDEWRGLIDEAINRAWDPVEQGMYDDDPNPYHGDYSEM